jgi:hypothetical protein
MNKGSKLKKNTIFNKKEDNLYVIENDDDELMPNDQNWVCSKNWRLLLKVMNQSKCFESPIEKELSALGEAIVNIHKIVPDFLKKDI